MDRNALLIYLQDIRDLEVVKKQMEIVYYDHLTRYKEMIDDSPLSYFRELNSGVDVVYHSPPKEKPKKHMGFLIGLVISGFFFTFMIYKYFFATGMEETAVKQGFSWLRSILRTELNTAVLLITIATGFCFFVFLYLTVKNLNLYREAYTEWKADAEKRIRFKEYVEKEWNKTRQEFETENSKVTSLLNDYYKMNIIPLQYRGLSGACYIYEYMASSQLSFESMILSKQFDEGIKKMESRLDQMIDSYEIFLYEPRWAQYARDEKQRLIEQNEKMLISLYQNENNTQLAEQYKQLSANYSKTNAYFLRSDFSWYLDL